MSAKPSECRDCHQPVRWWRSTIREGGWMCVDWSPDDAGTVKRVPSKDPRTRKPLMFGRSLSGRDLAEALADGELLFQLHTRTCPAKGNNNAEHHPSRTRTDPPEPRQPAP